MSTVVEDKKYELIDPSMIGNTEEVEIDSTVSSFDHSTPLPAGLYRAQLALPEAGSKNAENKGLRQYRFEKGRDAGKPWWMQFYGLKINEFFDAARDNAGLQGKRKNFNLTAKSMIEHIDGKPTSEMATVLLALGVPLPAKMPVGDIVKALNTMLSQSPQVGAKVVVVGQIKTDKLQKGSTDKYVYKTVFYGEDSIPKLADGSPDFNATYQGQRVFFGNEIAGLFNLAIGR